jgi:N-acetylglucosamine malate deacetylase 1
MMPFVFAPDESVVAITAHPDDAELLCYGTLRAFQAAGATVAVVIVTRGHNGTSIYDDVPSLLDHQRMAESCASFAGTEITVQFLDFTDGELSVTRPLVSSIEHELAARHCTVLITHSTTSATDHQDHRCVGLSAVNAASRVSTCHTILHGEPHAPRSGFSPNVLVDVSDYIDAKVDALTRHRTQAGRWYLTERYVRDRARAVGWKTDPSRAAIGRSFEGFECSLMRISLPGPHACITQQVGDQP